MNLIGYPGDAALLVVVFTVVCAFMLAAVTVAHAGRGVVEWLADRDLRRIRREQERAYPAPKGRSNR